MPNESENKYFKLFPSGNTYTPLTKEQSLLRAQGSLIEAWFDTMKMSPWYRAMLGGYDKFLTDYPSSEKETAKQNIEIFGDIRKMTFADWWMRKGYDVFAEKVPYLPMRSVAVRYPQGRTTIPQDALGQDPEAYLTVDIPLNLDREALHRQLDDILDEIDRYEGNFNRWKYSTAELHFAMEPKKGTTPALIKYWLDVYKHYEWNLQKKSEYPLWKLCEDKRIPVELSEADFARLPQTEIDQKKSDAASAVLKDARALMANALFRTFPDSRPIDLSTHFAFSEFAKYVDKVPKKKHDSNSTRARRKREAEATDKNKVK